MNGTILTFKENSDTYQYYYIVKDSNAWVNIFTIKLHTHTKYGSWVSNSEGAHTKTCATGGCGFTETETGYTGDTYCESCNAKISSGSKIAALGHEKSETYKYDKKTHWKICLRDGCMGKFDISDHTGGVATVDKPAECEICKQPYGKCLPGFATIFGTSVTGKPGKEITVDMNLVENTGIASMLVEINYDKTALEFVSAENGNVFDIGSFDGPDRDSDYKVLTWQNGTLTRNITETGKLAVLKFRIKDEAAVGNYEIAFKCNSEKYEALDAEMNAVNVIADTSKVTIVRFFYGDVNGNDKVDSSDALQLRRYLAKWKGYIVNAEAADLDLDEKITLRDITILQRHIAGWKGYEKLPVTAETLPIA